MSWENETGSFALGDFAVEKRRRDPQAGSPGSALARSTTSATISFSTPAAIPRVFRICPG